MCTHTHTPTLSLTHAIIVPPGKGGYGSAGAEQAKLFNKQSKRNGLDIKSEQNYALETSTRRPSHYLQTIMTPFIIWMVKALPRPHNTGVSFESASVCSRNNNEVSQALMFSHKARGSVAPLCWRHANEALSLPQSMCPVWYTAHSYTKGVMLNKRMGTRGLQSS